jgi:hypothetical protein
VSVAAVEVSVLEADSLVDLPAAVSLAALPDLIGVVFGSDPELAGSDPRFAAAGLPEPDGMDVVFGLVSAGLPDAGASGRPVPVGA